jgi:hypothetical protein
MAGNAPVKREPKKNKVDEAIAYERDLAQQAEKVREEFDEPLMDRRLFMALWPLLTAPIPEGFLLTVSAGEGKPYPSTGVRSVQVQKNRLDNVLGPLWWSERREYSDDYKLCTVTIAVHDSNGEAILTRQAYGGVDRGNTLGNKAKGSYTNAAKQAFAQIGPGREVYIGATDNDPDVDPEAAKQQSRSSRVAREEPPPDYDAQLRALLAKQDEFTTLRANADALMSSVGATPRQRLRELQSARTEQGFSDLIDRVTAVAESRQQELVPPPDEPPAG